MNMKIFKYQIGLSPDVQVVQLPRNAEIISLVSTRVPSHIDEGPKDQLYYHAIVDPKAPTEERRLWCVGTGWEIPSNLRHIATINIRGFMWHLLEEDNRKKKE